MEPVSAFLTCHEDTVHRLVRNHPQGHCIQHRARRWASCEWCCSLHNETLFVLSAKLESGIPDDPASWFYLTIDNVVKDAVRRLRGQLGVGTRPERHPGWLLDLLDNNWRDLRIVEQIRWWAGPQPVAPEHTLIPYAYLAARLGEPNSPDLREHITTVLGLVEGTKADWYYQNIGRSLDERHTGAWIAEPEDDQPSPTVSLDELEALGLAA